MTQLFTWISATGAELELSGTILVRDGAVGLDAPPPVLSTADAFADGLSLSNARFDARRVALPIALLLDAPDLPTIHTGKATLAQQMNVKRGPGQLQYDVDGRRRTLTNVYYEGGLEGDETQTRNYWALFVLSLLALDPFWYEPEQSIVLSSPSVPAAWNSAIPWSSEYPWDGPGVGITSGLTWNAPEVWNAALPWDGGVLVTPGVDGDADVWPRFTFTGPADGFSLVHVRTNERIELAAGKTLGEGETVVVETQPGALRGVTSGGVSAWTMLTTDSTASMMLETGDQLAVVMSGTGVNSKIRIAWSNRWLTPYTGALTNYGEELVTIDGGSP